MIEILRPYTYLIGCLGAIWLPIGLLAFMSIRRRQRRTVMSPAELAEFEKQREKERQDRQLFIAIRQEARTLSRTISDQLATQNKMVHYYQARQRRGVRYRKARKIKFEWVGLTRTEIWYRFDGSKMPFGTSFADLIDPKNNVIPNLQYAVGRPCRFHTDYKYNLFLRVGLHNSLLGIPKLVYWKNIIEKLPQKRPFVVPIGVDENQKLVYQDLTNWPHGLVTGATQNGKTVLLKMWLTTLISRNSPDTLKLCLIDLKRVELFEFAGAPHVIHHADRADDVQRVLVWLQAEMNRRLDMFVGICSDINGWNVQRPHQRLPRIFVFVDELASLTTDRHLRQAALDSIVDIARVGRAPGIHLILCTQNVDKTVLPMSILANVEGRITFRLNNTNASTLVVGNGLAETIDHTGRALYLDKNGFTFCQAPLIEEKEIKEAIEKATQKEQEAVEPNELDIFRVVLHNLGGNAGWNTIFDAIGGEWPANKIKTILKQYQYDPESPENSVIELDGSRYILAPSPRPGVPRMLIPVNGHLPKTAAEIEDMRLGYMANKQAAIEANGDNHTPVNGKVGQGQETATTINTPQIAIPTTNEDL